MLKPYETCIKDTSEKAMQRAIILNKSAILSNVKVQWYDIEVPVKNHATRNKRDSCLDLIGKGDNGEYYLCELKFHSSKSAGDPPQDARNELYGYLENIKLNIDNLDEDYEFNHHPNGIGFKWHDVLASKINLIVAANAPYWGHWIDKKNHTLPEGVECYSIDVEKDCFEKQKGSLDEYTPSYDVNEWPKL